MDQTDPNRPNRFLPKKDDFVYGDSSTYFQPQGPDVTQHPILQPEIPGQELFDIYKRPPSPKLILPDDSYFYINVSGQIEYADFQGVDSLFMKYDFVAGPEWQIIYGQKSGGSQTAYKARGSNRRLVWNFPFNLGFRSTNLKGWPQLIITCIGGDFLGREVIKGYGNGHIPTQPGRHERTLYMYRPKSSSILVNFIGALKGKLAELIDPPSTLGMADGREVTRMESGGSVKIVFQVSQTNMEKFGYSVKSIS
ncbi:unnamed protein product [Blepharisma stoltei]|uniref:B9 domain-containing protein 1 n=1 Tax=Blepharisma stoltei TaxID=1481888 RepID=A0AAU9K9E1_9CILI|nr:unnamed protein product [Blepharisma stoltei]